MVFARFRACGYVVVLLLASGCGGGGGGSGPAVREQPAGPATAPAPAPAPAPSPDPAGPQPDPQPVPGPTVSLQAADEVVDDGASTQLDWTSTDADGCDASGGWSGPRPVTGSEPTEALSRQTTFTLSCDGAGGSAMSMISVAVNDQVVIKWLKPTQNEDGSPLTDLSGFRIYFGGASRAYSDSVDVLEPETVSYDLVLPSGDYFLAMTALDTEGNESAYSNEVMRAVD